MFGVPHLCGWVFATPRGPRPPKGGTPNPEVLRLEFRIYAVGRGCALRMPTDEKLARLISFHEMMSEPTEPSPPSQDQTPGCGRRG